MVASELWKPVVGFASHYEVSSLGRVRRTARGKSTLPGTILKPQSVNGGYHQVGLSVYGSTYLRRVHHLVTEAFLGPRPKGMQVNHKDGVRNNNAIQNLEYVTPLENARHWAGTLKKRPENALQLAWLVRTVRAEVGPNPKRGRITAVARKYGKPHGWVHYALKPESYAYLSGTSFEKRDAI